MVSARPPVTMYKEADLSADASADIPVLRALGHPLRRSILHEMGGGEEISPRDLSKRMVVPLANVAYHMRVLAECEAIVLVRTQPVRGSRQHFYQLALKAEWARKIVGLPSPPLSGG